MAHSLPSHSLSVDTTRSGFGSGSELIAVLFCASAGINEPTMIGSAKAAVDKYGHREGTEFISLYVENTKTARSPRRPVLACAMPIVTAGEVVDDDTDVAGTSAVTVTGTPLDALDGIIEFSVGGTIGTDGIQFRYSLDGGATYTSTLKLGVATTYPIPNTGMTINFAAGTIVAGDVATFFTTPPAPNAAGIIAAFTALKEQSRSVRRVVYVGPLTSALSAELETQIEAYFSSAERDAGAMCFARDWYHDVRMTGAPSITFDDTTRTATRATGSFVTDGFKAGMTATITNTTLNNFSAKILTVSVTVLTFVTGTVVADEVDATTTITAEELLVDMHAAAVSDHGAIDSYRMAISEGYLRQPASPINGRKPRRPVGWAHVIRSMQGDVKTSTARVKDGPLTGWSCVDVDDNDRIVEYDDRTDAIALADRFIVMRTFSGSNDPYIALPVTRFPDSTSGYSIEPIVDVLNLGNSIIRRVMITELNDDVELDDSGFLGEEDRSKIESVVTNELESALLADIGGDGPRASSLEFSISETDDLRAQGSPVNYAWEFESLKYLTQFNGVARVNSNG